MTVAMISLANILIILVSCCSAKSSWRGVDTLITGNILERQSCPNPATCASGAQTCSSQTCPSGQRCCIDFGANLACCLSSPLNTTTTAKATTTTPAGTTTTIAAVGPAPACTIIGAKCASNENGVPATCDVDNNCYEDETCCRVNTYPVGCCVQVATRPPAGIR